METYIKKMNKMLILHYGNDLDSHPRFRLSWSEDLLEKRKKNDAEGSFELLKKYSYIKDRWILEVHTPQQELLNDVISSDHYEPLWLYTANKGEYYCPKWDDLALLVTSFIEQVVKPHKMNDEQMKKEAEEKVKEAEDEVFDRLQQENSFLSHQIHGREAVSFAGMKRKES